MKRSISKTVYCKRAELERGGGEREKEKLTLSPVRAEVDIRFGD